MPWSGTGVYTRGYASWTADATSNLPISATKFDTEDNDFAAGIQNCLTIDNQNKPNATLTWAQALSLTKATDATVFSIARTGGTNNPSLAWSVLDSANEVIATLATGNQALNFNPSSYLFGNQTDLPSFTFVGTGLNVNLNAVSNIGLYINGFTAGQAVLGFKVAGTIYGIIGVAGAANQGVNGSVLGDMVLRSTSGNILFTVDGGTTIKAELTSAGVFEICDNAASPSLFAAGYLGLPQNAQSSGYTTVLSDQGKHILWTSGSPGTVTIAAHASVAYPVGATLSFGVNLGAGALTIAINTDQLVWSSGGGTGSRTLAAAGMATALYIGSNRWLISGTGLT